jgi:hypothetical protein
MVTAVKIGHFTDHLLITNADGAIATAWGLRSVTHINCTTARVVGVIFILWLQKRKAAQVTSQNHPAAKKSSQIWM